MDSHGVGLINGVEAFVLRGDFTAAGIDSAAWSRSGGTSPAAGWRGAAGLSRLVRADASVRGTVSPASRAEIEARFGVLPDEASLRTYLTGRTDLAWAPPLRLGATGALVYRILLADQPLRPGPVPCGSPTRLEVDGHDCQWRLRRIGDGLAWGVDLTVHPGGDDLAAVGALLTDLRSMARRQGLIPVTVERLA